MNPIRKLRRKVAAVYLKRERKKVHGLTLTKKDREAIDHQLDVTRSSKGMDNFFEGYRTYMHVNLLAFRVGFANKQREDARKAARAIGGKRPVPKIIRKKKA